MFFQLNKWATSKHISIGKPDGIASKAIAHGSLSWLIRSAVQLRIAKFHYGAETDAVYDSYDRAMSGRRRFQNIFGETRVRYMWKSIVSKVPVLSWGDRYNLIYIFFLREPSWNLKPSSI